MDQDAVILVNQSNGEWPELVSPQIHCLVTTKEFASANESTILGLTRGVYRAQQLLRADLNAAADALFKSGLTGLERPKVEKILSIYQPAIPETPAVSVDGVLKATRFGPRRSGSGGNAPGSGAGGGGGRWPRGWQWWWRWRRWRGRPGRRPWPGRCRLGDGPEQRQHR